MMADVSKPARSKVMREGEIKRVSPAGLGFVEDDATRTLFAFTFDKIDNYRGETPRELGLAKGRHVRFTTEDDKVVSVQLLA